MDYALCPHCRVRVPLEGKDISPDQEIVECPGCGMLIDIKDIARRREELEVASEWDSVKAKRRREVNLTLVVLLLGSIIAGITVYVFWILNRYK